MRQLLSWRFVAAVAAVAGLSLIALLISSRGSSFSDVTGVDADEPRRMDFVSLVAAIDAENFELSSSGVVSGNLTMVMPNGQRVQAHPGTPGVVNCENLTDQYQCAVLGQSLGDTIVWFALMPMRAEFRFELPAITDLEGGYARLVNGWEVPYASTIDRSDCDPDSASFAEFLDEYGESFVSVYDLTEDAIVAVDCEGPPPTIPASTTPP
jgi:hypothetical protein